MKPLFTKSLRIKADPYNRLVLEHATKFILEGKWSLTEDHALNFKVTTKDSYLEGKSLIFHGEVESVKGDSLRLKVRRSEPLSGIRSGTIELKGKWQADENNRICFKVAKADGRYDTLRFQGAWQVNKKNELTYRYRKTYLKTKENDIHTITFNGSWQFKFHKLIYRIDRSTDSAFSIKAQIASPKISCSSEWIKYSVGIKYSYKSNLRTKRQLITIYGRWSLTDDLKVVFEVDYLSRRRREVIFGVEKLIAEKTKLSLRLKDAEDRPLGVELSFKKAFASDSDLFLALSKAGEDLRIQGGVKVKF